MPLRPILRLLLAGLLAGVSVLTPMPRLDPRLPTLDPPTVLADGPGDWPMFGHDPAHTGYNSNETQITTPLRLRWSYQTGGEVESSPAVVDDVLYVGSRDGKVYALGALDGAVRWTFQTGGSMQSSSPAVVSGTVYVAAVNNRVYALDATTGAQQWSYTTGDNAAHATVADGTAYVLSNPPDSRIYALNATTGDLRWSYQVVGYPNRTAVANGMVYTPASDGRLYALDATNGSLRWSYNTGNSLWGQSPSVVNGIVYLPGYDPRTIYALDAATGALQWSHSTGSEIPYSSPAVAGGIVYVGTRACPGCQNGTLYALNASTGALVWSYQAGFFLSSPAIASGVLYVGSADRRVYAFNAGNGTLLWSYETGSEIWSSPAVANGMLVVGSKDGKLYAFMADVASSVSALAGYQTSSSFIVNWSGSATATSFDIQYRDGASGMWTDWMTATTTLSSTFTGGQDGHSYYFQSRARDTGGNVEAYLGGSGDTYTTVDLTAPTGSIQAQGWSSPYISNTITLSVAATDATSGMSQMQFGPDSQSFNSWETYATSSLYVAPPGATAVYARFKDRAQNVSTPVSATITLDDVSPTGTISINAGVAYANALTSTLTLSSTDSLSGLSAMSLSNDGSTWSDWQGYATSKPWSLAAGPDGSRTVYARFRDAAQNVFAAYSDTIIVDTTAPSGSISVNGGAPDTNSTSVTLALPASDALSGMGETSLSNDGQNYGDWESYAAEKSWRLQGGNGTKTVYARFRDTVGNVSAPVSDTIIFNSILPSSAVTALSPFQNTAAFTVTWSGTALGSGLDSYDVQYRDGASGGWTDWITHALSTTTSAVFTGAEGHTYYFQSRATDKAGNVEPYVGGDGHTRTTVDLTPPTGAITINAGALDTTALMVTLGLSASDLLSGVAQASYSNDGSVWSAWEAYAPTKMWNLPSSDGEKPVWARFRDNAGNTSSPVSDTIRLDTSVDPSYGFSVNDGALFTSQATVTLSLPANPHTAGMMLSNDGGFRGAVWQPYSAYKAWAVTQYGSYVIPRTVYVKYKDVSGNVSAVYQDDIILDLTAPSGSISIEGTGAASTGRTTSAAVNLKLSANDDVSGVGGMMVSNSPAFNGASWEAFSASKSWSLGTGGKVYVSFKDNAGNASPVYAATLSGDKESLPSVVLGAVHPKTGGAIASSETGTSVAFPAGAVTAMADVTLVPAVETSLQINTGVLRGTGKFLTLTAKAGETDVTSVSRPYTITVTYAAADVVGMDQSTLGIYWWNGTAWQKETSSQVDTVAKTVSAALDHLSAFAVLGESSTRKIYLPLVIKSYGAGW